jgi:chromate reductase
LVTDDGEVTDKTTEQFLRDFVNEFKQFIIRVLTVLPRSS